MNRLRELDFLRGMAIILVLLRHTPFSKWTENMGWIGVDLFFVLSGFLVSGLLFREYLKFGDIDPKLFLIRRGFKIYPIYYIFYIPYLLVLIRIGPLDKSGLLSDITFTQNYLRDWGYAYGASWSLAVEEHFYFGFAFLLWLGIKTGKTVFARSGGRMFSADSLETRCVAFLILILIIRIFSNSSILGSHSDAKLFTMTHLRIDSLMTGVLISYLFNFHLDYLRRHFERYKLPLALIVISGLSWTPFLDPVPSFFAKTLGFTLLYVSFGIVLVSFLLTKDINQLLDKFLSRPVVDLISKIGFCSYSIYIIHSLVINMIHALMKNNQHVPVILDNRLLIFLVNSSLSVVIGMLMTYKIENYFLRVRNIHFPSRV